MPNLSDALLKHFGISAYLYFMDNKQHNLLHVHVKYQGLEAILTISDGKHIDGDRLPRRARKRIRAWIEAYDEALMDRWNLAVNGKDFEPIA